MIDIKYLRLRDLGIRPGVYETGSLNAITDVEGVAVGHATVIDGDRIRTGATAILPHDGNLFQDKVPAALAVLNGFGKFAGSTQIEELGELETPVILTNTLATGRAIEAINRWTLTQPGNEKVVSLNAVVGETNDSRLNDIRAGRPTIDEMGAALAAAKTGVIEEGAVGAGTGTVAFGLKGGIGTSSRRVKAAGEVFTLGVLVQSNYGGRLTVCGRAYEAPAAHDRDGSIVIVIATDAPLSSRNLKRLAERAFGGLARTGAALSNGSGDYALAFSTASTVRRTRARRAAIVQYPDLANDLMSPLFEAVIEATEEAILNSLTTARTTQGFNAASGKPSTIEAISLERLRAMSQR
ncbi:MULTISPECIES: P1 family peptidase [unclassified Ensifer]|uniref:DmpA family aminopeptidase n=1 Tax=unclassified Ensifer TaxID=2633371 RepID=UPI0008136060|nr:MULTISPECIES: P1 family peptidase [unclassified Ensifer]OCP05625.1 aminopeptidase [Ensifer sp. LC11]OCP06365.1 aminopeptidase [Ensifer sp. LC13]OCP06908.1 aminopeptidase [Ensifer sp. LC14]OCP31396.1 aminopeptidase [Ensifer sp. LC499]